MADEYDITRDETFWYKVGVDYDKESRLEGNILDNLIKSFISVGRKHFLEQRISLDTLNELPHNELRESIFNAYVEWLWSKRTTGPAYEVANKEAAEEVFSTDEEGNIIAEKVGKFKILWKIEPTIGVEGDIKTGTVIGRKIQTAESVILKMEGEKYEIRGRKKLVKFVCKQKLEKNGKFKKIELEPITQNIVEKIEEFVFEDSDFFSLLGIKFRETYLPNKSKLIIKHDRDIKEDLKKLESQGIIHTKAFTDIIKIFLKSNKTSKKFAIKVIHRDRGFELKIDDNNMDDSERAELRTTLSGFYGPIFDVIHDYRTQYDTRFIFHKILDGSVITYDKYFQNLPEDKRKILSEITEIETVEDYICQSCEEKTDGKECGKCGSTKIRKETKRVIFVKDSGIMKMIREKIRDVGENFESDKKSYGKIEIDDKLNLTFFMRERAGNEEKSRFTKFQIIPMSKGRIPKKSDEYLGNYGFIIYGNSWFNQGRFRSFGFLDLYDLIFSESEKLRNSISMMIENSIKGLEERIVSLSSEAESRINLPHDYENKPKDFERDIFYMFKRFLPLSERWGRVGKRESDGLMVFSDKDDNYFVASYDPKFSIGDYNLDSEEQNKAVFYILDENNLDGIKLLRKTTIDSHVFVLNSFNEEKIPNFVNGIKNWYRLVKSSESKVNVPIIFIKSEYVSKIHRLYCQKSAVIKGSPKFHNEFLDGIKILLSSEEPFKIIDNSHLEKFKEKLIKMEKSIQYQGPTKIVN
jgi:hypothetical protein